MTYYNQVGIKDIQSGKQAKVSLFRTLATCEPTKLVGQSFEGTIDANFWTATATGGSGVASGQATGLYTLTSGTASGAVSSVDSVRAARFISGQQNYCRIVCLCPAGIANNVKRWGAGNGVVNGLYFSMEGTSFGIKTYKNSAAAALVAQANFKPDGTNTVAYTLDVAKYHTYEIWYNPVLTQFYIDDVLVHTELMATAMLTDTLVFKVHAANTNSAIVADSNLVIRIANIYTMGAIKSAPTYKPCGAAATTICKTSAGFLHSIILTNTSTNSSTFSVYDDPSTTNNPIIVINVGTSDTPATIEVGCIFSNGLTVITTGAGSTCTAIYE